MLKSVNELRRVGFWAPEEVGEKRSGRGGGGKKKKGKISKKNQ